MPHLIVFAVLLTLASLAFVEFFDDPQRLREPVIKGVALIDAYCEEIELRAPPVSASACLTRNDSHKPHGKRTLTDAHRAFLEQQGWSERVGDGPGVWVSVPDQTFRVIRGGELVWQAACSTAAAGVGAQMNSFKTPLGWHSVAEKIGEGAQWGQVFREKRATKEIWRPGDPTREDLVLTRVLPLAGEEPGKNQGGCVDSYARRIYIHGTNDEAAIGTPASHGCIRLTNDDVIAAYELLRVETPVLISE